MPSSDFHSSSRSDSARKDRLQALLEQLSLVARSDIRAMSAEVLGVGVTLTGGIIGRRPEHRQFT